MIKHYNAHNLSSPTRPIPWGQTLLRLAAMTAMTAAVLGGLSQWSPASARYNYQHQILRFKHYSPHKLSHPTTPRPRGQTLLRPMGATVRTVATAGGLPPWSAESYPLQILMPDIQDQTSQTVQSVQTYRATSAGTVPFTADGGGGGDSGDGRGSVPAESGESLVTNRGTGC